MKKILVSYICNYESYKVVTYLLGKEFSIYTLQIDKAFSSINSSVHNFNINLKDIAEVKRVLFENKFDVIYHSGIIISKLSDKKAEELNLKITEQFISLALKNGFKFIFNSTVGIFGNSAVELPINERAKRQKETLVAKVAINSEKVIENYILKGLDAYILRPSPLIYGEFNYGLIYDLFQNILRKKFYKPKQPTWIHLCNIEMYCLVVYKLIIREKINRNSFFVADWEPVRLDKLTQFIAKNLDIKDNSFIKSEIDLNNNKKKYPKNKILFPQSKFFYVDNTYKHLEIKIFKTIPEIRKMINWYKENL